jgi:hypothetical protein
MSMNREAMRERRDPNRDSGRRTGMVLVIEERQTFLSGVDVLSNYTAVRPGDATGKSTASSMLTVRMPVCLPPRWL